MAFASPVRNGNVAHRCAHTKLLMIYREEVGKCYNTLCSQPFSDATHRRVFVVVVFSGAVLEL